MSPAAVMAIETKDLWRVYPCRSGAAGEGVPALRGIEMKVKTGQFVVLRGRSGSGKTTLLNILAGLDSPTSGSVSVLGHNLAEMSEQDLTIWRREQIGLVFQSFGLLATLSAYENVELLLRIQGSDPQQSHQRTMEVLEMVGLTRWRDHRPYELSGGQQQRVAIARALANNARLILADEPTGELDSRTGHEILSFLRNLVDTTHITLLMASHDPLVDKYAQHVLTLEDGMLTAPEKKK
ncbi:MAG: ABC transporter ATP-binding protein [Anaerolineales bacterium]|nr:ABC transporter ATP-binding protein [Anaerolineales bacterium]